jgi:predicted alpha/beta superfamily hydrolase
VRVGAAKGASLIGEKVRLSSESGGGAKIGSSYGGKFSQFLWYTVQWVL